MKIDSGLSFRRQFLLLIILAILPLLFFLSFHFKELSLETRKGAAGSQFESWKIAIIGDTQCDNKTVLAKMMAAVKTVFPSILFHVGDLEWGTYNTESLKGTIAIQYQNIVNGVGLPTEIHIAPGNHDGVSNHNDEDTLKLSYLNSICFGKHLENEKTGTYRSGFYPFNKEVAKVPGYCTETGTRHYYSFVRGGIKFIILDMPFYHKQATQQEWFRQQVCNPGGASATIAFLHECDFPAIHSFINNLNCQHNLKAVFTGHGHEYRYQVLGGVNVVETAGMWGDINQFNEGIGKMWVNDYLYGVVNQREVIFYRVFWQMDKPNLSSPVEIFRISGNFSNYENPFISPTLTPSPTATLTPTLTPKLTPTPTRGLTATPTRTPTLVSTPSPSVTTAARPTERDLPVSNQTKRFNFKLAIAGIEDFEEIVGFPRFSIKLINQKGEILEKIINLHYDGKGVFSGSLEVSQNLLGPFRFWAKTEKTLGMVFCRNNQRERCLNNEWFEWGDENEIFDFSQMPLEPGDIAGREGAFFQDGVVNSLDFSVLKSKLGSQLESDLKIADLDYNGVVNGRDIAVFLQTLSTKFEEN